MNILQQTLADRIGLPSEALDIFTAVLDEGAFARLDGMVAAAVDTEDFAVQRGVAEALEQIPWPVRGAARAMMNGGE